MSKITKLIELFCKDGKGEVKYLQKMPKSVQNTFIFYSIYSIINKVGILELSNKILNYFKNDKTCIKNRVKPTYNIGNHLLTNAQNHDESLLRFSGYCPEGPEDTNMCKLLKTVITNPNRIKLRPHFDAVTLKDHKLKGQRIQAFLTTEIGRDPSNLDSIIGRSTIFIPESYRHISLFTSYWIVYHSNHIRACVEECEDNCKIRMEKGKRKKTRCGDCLKKPFTGCPEFFHDMNIIRFNNDLQKLFKFLETKEGNKKIKKWWDLIPEDEKKKINDGNIPRHFDVVVSNFKNGDLVLFMPGTIHWVMDPKPNDKLLVKAFFEVYGFNKLKSDKSGYALSDGGFKKEARDYEFQQLEKHPEAAKTPLETKESDFYPPMCQYNLMKCLYHLDTDGVVVIKMVKENSGRKVMDDITIYLEKLIGFPPDKHITNLKVVGALTSGVKYTKKMGLTDVHRFRKPEATSRTKNSTSIFFGNTGMGSMGPLSKKDGLLYNEIIKLLNPLYNYIFNTSVKISAIGYGVQGPKYNTKWDKK